MSLNTLGERISYARRVRGLTLDNIAQAVGVHKSTIQRYEKDEYNNPKLPVIESIARALSVNPVWLVGKSDDMDGTVEPAPVEDVTFPVREIDDLYDALNNAGQKELCSYGRYLCTVEEYKAKEPPKRAAPARIIPLLGVAFAAGSPEAPGDLMAVDYKTTDPRAEFAIHVNGDSMEPWLPDGSVALGVKRLPRDGEVGAFFLDGGFLVKQFALDSQGNAYLFSLNRAREDADETVWHDSGRDLRPIGTILLDQKLPLP